MVNKIIAILALVFVFAATEAQAKKLRVALVLPGPITDGTFSTAAYKGIKAAEKKYDLKISVQENTSFAKSEAALRSFAQDGYDIVIGHNHKLGIHELA